MASETPDPARPDGAPLAAAPTSSARARGKVPTWLILVLVLAGAGIVAVGGFAGLVYLYIATSEEVPVTDAERAAVLTAEDLLDQIEDERGTGGKPSIKKSKYFDGSWELDYEYDSADLYVTTNINVERKASDATAGYASMLSAMKATLALTGEGTTMQRKDDILSAGAQSAWYMVRNAQQDPVGNTFICRQGKVVTMFSFVGVYFDDPEIVAEVFGPKLRAAAALQHR